MRKISLLSAIFITALAFSQTNCETLKKENEVLKSTNKILTSENEYLKKYWKSINLFLRLKKITHHSK